MTWIKNILEVNVASFRPRTIGPQNVDLYGHHLESTQPKRRKPQRWRSNDFYESSFRFVLSCWVICGGERALRVWRSKRAKRVSA